ncbi:MAG: hypothetical protein Tsb0017_18870 [Geothermobacteraceae bacterium]
MNIAETPATNDCQHPSLYQASRLRRRREICDLIASPWWDALDRERQENWLNQLRELSR